MSADSTPSFEQVTVPKEALDRWQQALGERDRYRAALEEILERHAPGEGEADYDIAQRALNGSSTQ
jgi:hypothetical protein